MWHKGRWQPITGKNGYKYHIQWLTTRQAFSLGLPRGKGYVTSPLTPDISLFSLLHAPSAPPMTVANHWPLAEIVQPSKSSG